MFASVCRLSLRLLAAAVLSSALAAPALAQAPWNPSLARVGYNTLKNTAKPEGELKAQIDAIDKEIAEATRLGRTGQLRRLYAKGTALLRGRTWTEMDEFQQSLALRSDRVLVDPASPYQVRLEQIFAPAIELTKPLSARASLRKRLPPALPSNAPPPGNTAAPAAAPPAPAPEPARELGKYDGVQRDLRESPFALQLDLSGVENGSYVLDVEVVDDTRALGTATLNVSVQKDLDPRLRALETAALTAPPEVRADLLYPADYLKKINRGVVDLGAFNIGAELTAAEAIAVAAKAKKNAFVGRTGDFERHYLLEAAGEIMPYRVYVPKRYDGARAYPLIIALHGLGANEDSFLDGYGKRVPALAEEHGYIVASPLGFRVDGFYGYAALAGNDTASRRRSELSEQDVMEVLKRMRLQYKVDPSRIYLMGHSMGAIGTWAIAAKYPDIWAALAPYAGLGNPASVERFKHIPELVVHGDADATVNVSGSRTMVAEMKKLGTEVQYIEVPGGSHTGVVAPNLPAAFEFFNTHKKMMPATQER